MKRSQVVLLSLVCYLIPVLGPIYMLIQKDENGFAKVHGRQMLALVVTLAVLFGGWIIVGWAVSWIPTVGPLIAAMLFALVIGGFIGGILVWIVGFVRALQGQVVKLPLVWDVSRRMFGTEI